MTTLKSSWKVAMKWTSTLSASDLDKCTPNPGPNQTLQFKCAWPPNFKPFFRMTKTWNYLFYATVGNGVKWQNFYSARWKNWTAAKTELFLGAPGPILSTLVFQFLHQSIRKFQQYLWCCLSALQSEPAKQIGATNRHFLHLCLMAQLHYASRGTCIWQIWRWSAQWAESQIPSGCDWNAEKANLLKATSLRLIAKSLTRRLLAHCWHFEHIANALAIWQATTLLIKFGVELGKQLATNIETE